MIVINDYTRDIKEFLKKSILDFLKLNPEVIVSCIGLYCCPWSGWLTLNFDTKQHSDSFVSKLKGKGRDYFGKDLMGEYCNNCPDFEYADFSNIDFEKWAEEYNNQDTIVIKLGLFKSVTVNHELDGDEGYNKVFFDYLIKLLVEMKEEQWLSRIKSEPVLRIGVEMLDSEYVEFWTLK